MSTMCHQKKLDPRRLLRSRPARPRGATARVPSPLARLFELG